MIYAVISIAIGEVALALWALGMSFGLRNVTNRLNGHRDRIEDIENDLGTP